MCVCAGGGAGRVGGRRGMDGRVFMFYVLAVLF